MLDVPSTRAGPHNIILIAVDTLRALGAQEPPETELILLMGSDQALDFQRWKDWQTILELARPAVMVRPPLDEAAYREELLAAYDASQAERWITWTVDVGQMDICATAVRERLASDHDASDLLPSEVLEYIRTHRLYQSDAS